jgi:hypothetical protein
MRGIFADHRPKPWFFLAALILLIAPDLAWAQPYPTPDTWGGTF